MKIKFRAFKNGEYVYSITEKGVDRLGWFFSNMKEYPIEQFIGLEDDNGKEIYTGDIIKHGCTTQYYESVVIYKAPSFLAANFYYAKNRFMNVDNDDVYEPMWNKKGFEAFHEGFYRTNMQIGGDNYLQVIGNINENPELL